MATDRRAGKAETARDGIETRVPVVMVLCCDAGWLRSRMCRFSGHRFGRAGYLNVCWCRYVEAFR